MAVRRIAHGVAALALAGAVVVGLPAGAAATPVPAAAWAPAACGPTFTDQLSAVPWPLLRLQPEMAWPISRGQGVLVAVIDSGVSATHPTLAGQVTPGNDLLDPSRHGDCDQDGHGTLVASLIVGKDTGGSPFHGIAPDAKVLPVRVLPNSQQNQDPAISQRVASAIVWATDNGADVINLSLFTTDTPELSDAVKYAIDHDVVVVAAAGNSGDSAGAPIYPASYPGVLAAGGVDQTGAHVSTSTVGDYVGVAAPGLDIQGAATQGGGYVVDQKGGTSFAAAYVSGVAALVRSAYPDLQVADVVRRIEATADAPADGHDDEVGAGVVNPYRAVATVLAKDDTLVPRSHDHLSATAGLDDGSARVRTIALVLGLAGVIAAIVMVVVVPLVRRASRAAHHDLVAAVRPQPDSRHQIMNRGLARYGEAARATHDQAFSVMDRPS